MKGELHPTKDREVGFGTMCVRSCIRMTDSDELICFLVWTIPETAMGILYNCFVGALPHTHYGVQSSPLELR